MALLGRFLDVPQVARIRAVLDIYGAAAGGLLANGLAFSTLFAAIPTTLLVLGVAGWLTNDPTVRTHVAEALISAFPPMADLIDELLDTIAAGAALTSILGVIGLVWTVSQLYGALDVAFARIFSNHPERDIVRRTARGLIVVAILMVAIVGYIVLTAVASAFEAMSPGSSPLPTVVTGFIGSVPFLFVVSVFGCPCGLPDAATAGASIAVGGPTRDRGRRRARRPQPGVLVPRPKTSRRGRARRIARVGVHRACLAGVRLPGVAVRRGVGPCPRGGDPRPTRAGRSHSDGRTWRWRRVTGRS